MTPGITTMARDKVNIVQEGNSLTIGDSVQIVLSGQSLSPNKINVTASQEVSKAKVKSGRSRSKSPQPGRCKAHNRFHHNCCSPERKKTRDDVKKESAKNVERMRSRSRSNLLSGSRQDLRGSRTNLSVNGKNGNAAVEKNLSKEEMKELLVGNPELLEQFVVENTDLDTLEKWMQMRAKSLGQVIKPPRAKNKLSSWKYSVHKDKRTMLDEMTNLLLNKGKILFELVTCISAAIDADEVNLHLVETEGFITKFLPDGSKDVKSEPQPIKSGTTVAAHCAKVKDIIKTNTLDKDPRFPEGVPNASVPSRILCHPICSQGEEVEAVVEFIKKGRGLFTEDDIEIVNSYFVWGGVAIHYSDEYFKVQHQKFVNEFLLKVVRSIFQEMISMDTLIVQIMNQAQKLVNADRASLFLMDSKTNQLYARIFDVTSKNKEENTLEVTQADKDLRDKARFPIGKGIAGYVAETGETLNVPDVYKDDRFNPSIDEQTGYTTKSILCMPISIRGAIIGVVQMVNKIGEDKVFTSEDEESFKTFAVYCGLALHHAKLYDKIRRSEQKYKVALEVLSYHNAASLEEVEEIIAQKDSILENDDDIASFSYYGTALDEMGKVKKALFMFVDLFSLERFEYDTLVRFFITVKKNYRAVAYHNWAHGFHVANSIYSILKASPGIFSPLECLAMFIGALCHDLDHRGFNNKFMIDIGSPLAAIYSTSTMENHHFNMTINILQQEQHNIFSKLNPDEYKQVLGNMKHCILATDLALFFPNKTRLTSIMETNSFSWDSPDHRLLLQALIMTGSDLCSAAKPWGVQYRTAQIIYAEFHEQGDVEKTLGWQPIPLFDRDNATEMPSMQVGFFSGICIPCYDLLARIMPSVTPMLENCANNLASWRKLADEKREELSNS